MKKIIAVLSMLFFLPSCSHLLNRKPAQGDKKAIYSYTLRKDGYGPVDVGMPVAQAAKALGARLPFQEGDEKDCYNSSPNGKYEGLSFMITSGKIARVQIFPHAAGHILKTAEGIQVGDSMGKVLSVYPKTTVRGHPYTEGKYLIVDHGQKFQYIFETDEKQIITSMRGGKTPEIGYIEGCY